MFGILLICILNKLCKKENEKEKGLYDKEFSFITNLIF